MTCRTAGLIVCQTFRTSCEDIRRTESILGNGLQFSAQKGMAYQVSNYIFKNVTLSPLKDVSASVQNRLGAGCAVSSTVRRVSASVMTSPVPSGTSACCRRLLTSLGTGSSPESGESTASWPPNTVTSLTGRTEQSISAGNT